LNQFPTHVKINLTDILKESESITAVEFWNWLVWI